MHLLYKSAILLIRYFKDTAYNGIFTGRTKIYFNKKNKRTDIPATSTIMKKHIKKFSRLR